DKPDTRFGLELTDLSEETRAASGTSPGGTGVPLFEAAIKAGGIVKALRLPAQHAGKMSRTETDKREEVVKGMGAKGLARAKVGAGGAWSQTPLKTITDAFRGEVNRLTGAGEGDLLFFQFGSAKLVNTVLGKLRLALGEKLGLIPPGQWKFLW